VKQPMSEPRFTRIGDRTDSKPEKTQTPRGKIRPPITGKQEKESTPPTTNHRLKKKRTARQRTLGGGGVGKELRGIHQSI